MTVRVGFLGAGLIARYHAGSLASSGVPVEWGGVYDPDAERAAAFAAPYGATVCGSEEAVLDSCDAVYVCTWTSEHRRLVEAAAARGLAVFCEKPLATDLDGARAMAATVAEAGVVNQVGLVLRRSPAFALVRDLVHETASGRVMSVRFRDDQYIPVQGFYASTWRGDPARAGAGTLHRALDPRRRPAGVGRRADRGGHRPLRRVPRPARHRGCGGAVVPLRRRRRRHALLDLARHARTPQHAPARGDLRVGLRVASRTTGTGPVRWMRPGEGERVVSGAELTAEVAARGLATGNPDGAFVEAVATGVPAWPSLADAVRAHEVVDAAYRSAAAGGAPVAVR